MTTPDMVAVARAILAPAIDPAKVGSQVPEPRPTRFVKVVAAGGPPLRDVVLTEAIITWEASSTAGSVDASTLAGAVRDAFYAAEGTAPSGFQLLKVDCTMPTYYPAEGAERYTGTATLLLRTP